MLPFKREFVTARWKYPLTGINSPPYTLKAKKEILINSVAIKEMVGE
jgi:hypothetical protein